MVQNKQQAVRGDWWIGRLLLSLFHWAAAPMGENTTRRPRQNRSGLRPADFGRIFAFDQLPLTSLLLPQAAHCLPFTSERSPLFLSEISVISCSKICLCELL